MSYQSKHTICFLSKMRDELVYESISENERVENVRICHIHDSGFNHPFKTIVIYNTEKFLNISVSVLRYFCSLESINYWLWVSSPTWTLNKTPL